MSEIVENPFVIEPGTVQRGRTRIRAYSEGELVADAVTPLLVWEHPYFPQYFFAPEDLEVEVRPASGRGPRSKALGPGERFDVVVGDRTLPGVAQRYPEAPVEAMRGAYALTWSAFDTWLEEDEVLHTHARNPYVRIDALPSSRHVRVVVGGEVVAESHRPVVLTETGLQPRYYLPRVDVRMDLLTPTDTTSHCPYKGEASYWTLDAGGKQLADVVWGYDTPLPESTRLAGLVCFWPEKTADLELYVDGERVGRP
ncbi:DUF427 domain-containing protein [Myceligenerans pegani]|uniref:DUF427 domain-containing protein n=1 Tax=Myceligenerans pegani TaxID=2776917 RepID=A0ABR9MX01_9MICO|nr:DUF427 domain-containing protein [Myceligenerans sp. TRM 65318]MBE1875650.1 DUF427 domain-containing protein [Myceligenerans sp. TRM 65318]MBE3017921.1 DUF427 domain-containing protein [Myceligenerans sp. TRM 65318]